MKGGRRFTHENLIVGTLDEVVILGHAVRHELAPLIGTPAFAPRLERLATEAVELADQLRHHARQMQVA